jgi:hypothetical protein
VEIVTACGYRLFEFLDFARFDQKQIAVHPSLDDWYQRYSDHGILIPGARNAG